MKTFHFILFIQVKTEPKNVIKKLGTPIQKSMKEQLQGELWE